MKKILCLVLVVVALMFFGCAKSTPEDAAKDYVNKQFTPAAGVKLDTTKLEYNVIKEDDDEVTIKVSGSIQYSETIYLVKEGDKWDVKGKSAQVKDIEPEQIVTH